MYSAGDADCTTRVWTPSSVAAFCRPTKARWLKPRSLRPPMSVIRPTLNDDPAVVVGVVVELAFFVDPHPAAARARARTSMAISGFFTALSEVLDCGTKTVSDSTWHTTVGVVLRTRDGRLEVLLRGGALPSAPLERGESLEAALARAVDTTALAHLEQLETLGRSDG